MGEGMGDGMKQGMPETQAALRLQRVMIGHGLLVMVMAMLAGFMLIFVLVGGFEVWPGTIVEFSVYGTSEGWVRAHSGGVTNGLMVIAVGLALPKLTLTATRQKWVAYGVIYSAWAFTVFYWLGNASANRALTFGDSPLGEASLVSIIGFLPGLPAVVIITVVLLIAARAAFAASD